MVSPGEVPVSSEGHFVDLPVEPCLVVAVDEGEELAVLLNLSDCTSSYAFAPWRHELLGRVD